MPMQWGSTLLGFHILLPMSVVANNHTLLIQRTCTITTCGLVSHYLNYKTMISTAMTKELCCWSVTGPCCLWPGYFGRRPVLFQQVALWLAICGCLSAFLFILAIIEITFFIAFLNLRDEALLTLNYYGMHSQAWRFSHTKVIQW